MSIMGPFVVVFVVLSKFKTSTELNKMASIERETQNLQEDHGRLELPIGSRAYTDYKMRGCLGCIGTIEITS